MKQDSKIQADERSKSLKRDAPSLPAQARLHAPAAVAELVRIIENTRSDAARLAAIHIFFDRGLGKPPRRLDIAIKDRVSPPQCRPAKSWSDLAKFAQQGLDKALSELLPGSTLGTLETDGES